jgi:hypothetical protein
MEKDGGLGFAAGINIFSRKEEMLPFKGCFRQFDPLEVLKGELQCATILRVFRITHYCKPL